MKPNKFFDRPIRILLAEDSPSDTQLTREALAAFESKIELAHVANGVEAVEYLRREGKYSQADQPDLFLLDLKMPLKDGCDVLREIKKDPELSAIPTIMLSTSVADEDVRDAYALGANCYIQKPIDFNHFQEVMLNIERFWLNTVRLPTEVEIP